MASFEQTSSVIDYLLALYPYLSGKLTSDRVEDMYTAYHGILCDLDYDNLKAAAVHVAATCRFFPSASEIRDTVFRLLSIAHRVPSADDAWSEVARKLAQPHALTIIGQKEDGTVIVQSNTLRQNDDGTWVELEPQWSTPLIHTAIEALGGWRYLKTSQDMMADSVHFKRAYDGYFERNKEAALMLPAVRQAIDRLTPVDAVQRLAAGGSR